MSIHASSFRLHPPFFPVRFHHAANAHHRNPAGRPAVRAQWTINGVEYDADANFTRDSFTFNTVYTLSPLYSDWTANIDTANGLNFDGTLGVEHIDGRVGDDWKVPTEGDYAVVITTFDALDLVDGIITNGLCLNLNGEPYLQIVFQNPNVWNLKQRSESGLTVHSSTDINGLGVSAATTTTNAASFFRIDATSNAVTFASATNCVYTVEGCTNLVAGGTLSSASADNRDGRAEEKRLVPPNWHTVTNLPGTGHRLSVPYTTNRFYRVKATLP